MTIRRQRRTMFIAASLLVPLVLFSSCNYFQDESILSKTTPLDSPISEEISKFDGVVGLECVPDITNYEVATLIDVIDGDSIKVVVDGKQTQVRYIGINTPEYDGPQRGKAIEATNENRDLLSGSELYLFKDVSNTDKYERLLRYVVANGKFINLELVQTGYAEVKRYYPDISCQDIFEKAIPSN